MQTMSDYHAMALDEALRHLAASPLSAAAIDRAATDAAAVATQLQKTVGSEIPEFSRSRNPDLLPEAAQHRQQNLAEIVRLLREGGPGRFEFVRAYARRRAEQRFPLEATLHAYRSEQKILARWLCHSAVRSASSGRRAQRIIAALTNFSVEYAAAISTTFAATYAAHSLLLAEVAGDQRSELLHILLDGHDEADPPVARILREAGFLNERQLLCVALARSVDPTEMLDVSRARRMADSIARIVSELPVRRVIDVYNNKVTMVFGAVSRDSGWTAPRSSLAREIHGVLSRVGNAALIGVSNDVPSTAHIPGAYKEATTALDLASVSQRILRFSEIPLRSLLIHFAAQDLRRVLPAWASSFRQADDKAAGALVATLRAYAGVDMNILKAAHVLRLHPNSVYARLQRIFEITGLKATSFGGLSDLLAVSDCIRDDAPRELRPTVQARANR